MTAASVHVTVEAATFALLEPEAKRRAAHIFEIDAALLDAQMIRVAEVNREAALNFMGEVVREDITVTATFDVWRQ